MKKVIVYILVCIALCLSYSLYISFGGLYFNADIDATKDFVAQVYYTENTSDKFSEKHSIKKDVRSGNSHLNIALPIKHIQNFRFDFGVNPGTVKISDMIIKGNKNLKLDINNFEYNKQITTHFMSGAQITIMSAESDPHIIYKSPVDLKGGTKINCFILFVLFCVYWFLFQKIVDYLCKINSDKKYSWLDLIFIVIFFAILFTPMLYVSDAEKSNQENRILATKPCLIINNDINEKYGTNFNDYFNDRFFGRSVFIKIYDSIYHKLSSIYKNNKALFVKNSGWMFQKKSFPLPKDTKIIIDNLKNFDDFCKQHGMKLYIMLVPEKEMVYQDILAHSWFFDKRKADIFNEYINKILDVLPGNRIIYPYQELLNAKNQDYVFFKQAHHWTDYGAYVGYKLLGERIKKDFNNFNIVSLNDYNKTFSKKIRDDWGRNYNIGNTTNLLNLNDKANKILDTEYTYYDNKDDKLVSENRQKYKKLFDNKNSNVKYKLFLTGNSQNENLLQYLPYSVKRLKYLRLNKGQQSNENQYKFMKYYKQELLDFKPDIVIVTVSSGILTELMTNLYKD